MHTGARAARRHRGPLRGGRG
ncbi:hypothetical protein [Nocardioides convexus]|nr:hypothetical protein [Nocardioides convexus]